MATLDPLPIPELGLPPAEVERRFDELQKRLVPLWRSIERLNRDPQTIVVIPSLTVDYDLSGALLQAYEERFLFLLLLLRQPRARLIYVTSQAVHPSIIDYYLGLLPGVIASHARERLHLVSPHDGSGHALTRKLLARAGLLDKIRALIPDPARAHMVPFNTTELERDLALRLGIPMYGADPRYLDYGTKSGCRRLFQEAGISYPIGFENLRDEGDVIDAVAEVRSKRPAGEQIMVKLNEGVSGEGNALVDARDLDPTDRRQVTERVRAMELASKSLSYDGFLDKLREGAGIVEERITGDWLESPSVQLRITPVGSAQLISTHDQLLAGTGGQTYLGCIFPAHSDYAQLICREAAAVGELLAERKVLGRFAIDFVVARQDGVWRSYAIELNLRKGGTTHPYLTLQFLTDGQYDGARNQFTTPAGSAKHYVASDNVVSPLYRAFTADDLFDVAVRNGLHFDQTRETGVVFHMLSALGEHGRLGLTAVANTREQAQELYDRTVAVLDAEAAEALRLRPL
jgi:hypothetical protein